VIGDLLQGVSAPLRGFRFLTAHPELRRLALVPLLVNALLFAVAIAVFVATFGAILAAATGFLAVGAGVGLVHALLVGLAWLASGIIAVLILALFAAAVFFGFTLVGGLVAAPFNEILSQRTEMLRMTELGLGAPPGTTPFTGLGSIWRDASYAFGAELKRIGFYLAVMAVLALLNLLPAAGTVLFTVLGGLASCYFFAWDHTDLSMGRRRMTFAQKRQLLAAHRFSAFGFGAMALAITAVPLLNLLMLPVQVVAGTLLYLEWTATEAKPRAS